MFGGESAIEEQEELGASSDAERGRSAGSRAHSINIVDKHKENILPIRPDSMPFAPSEENIQKLEEWLLKPFANNTFNVDAHQLPGTGNPQHIHIQEDDVPYAVHSTIPTPHHWREDVEKILQRDVKVGILENVPVGDPVEWCSRIVAVKKKDRTPRITKYTLS